MKNKLVIGLWLSFVFIFIGCTSSPYHAPSSQETRSLTGTKWVYVDEDWSYEVEFANNGILKTTHPNDKTPDDDFWEQKGDIVFLYFNNRFSTYEGQFITNDLIKGIGKSSFGSWEFELKRIK
jgi:hypothetical protein